MGEMTGLPLAWSAWHYAIAAGFALGRQPPSPATCPPAALPA